MHQFFDYQSSFITTLSASPLFDDPVVELHNGIPHLVPVVTDPRKAAGALNWAVNEMLNRYKIFAQYNVRDLHAYNRMVAANGGKPPVAEGEELPAD
ncbi:MAG: FtsK/SpoIIIE domain-containing protein [[Clostridium] leptum]